MGSAYIFDAELDGFRGVTRKLGLRGDQRLTDLHGLLQDAFAWADDHLYAFWLTGTFWDEAPMYTTPFELGPATGARTFRSPISASPPGRTSRTSSTSATSGG